jgi:hypothetical protein
MSQNSATPDTPVTPAGEFHPEQSLTLRRACEFLDLSATTLRQVPPDALPYWLHGARHDRRYVVRDLIAFRNARRRGGVAAIHAGASA